MQRRVEVLQAALDAFEELQTRRSEDEESGGERERSNLRDGLTSGSPKMKSLQKGCKAIQAPRWSFTSSSALLVKSRCAAEAGSASAFAAALVSPRYHVLRRSSIYSTKLHPTSYSSRSTRPFPRPPYPPESAPRSSWPSLPSPHRRG